MSDPPSSSTKGRSPAKISSARTRAEPSGADTTEADAFAQQISRVPLGQLRLDPNNPRLGLDAGKLKTQRDLVDRIVEAFGIEDVVSSIAVNGYFDAEPLVGVRQDDGTVVVVEGNRRLAACLILAGDPRGENQQRIAARHLETARENGVDPPASLPVAIFDAGSEMDFLPYLGVRHIAGSLQWGSYAKAKWIARVIEEEELELAQVSSMIGDSENICRRMLRGYYVTEQLMDEGRFDPGESHHRGRGAHTDFPFSWVYTALDRGPLRDWAGVPREPEPDPLHDAEAKERAAELFTFMFGTATVKPAIVESRQISVLAQVLPDKRGAPLLRAGRSAVEAAEELRSTEARLGDAMVRAEDALAKCVSLVSADPPSRGEARRLHDHAERIYGLAEDFLDTVEQLRSQRRRRRGAGGGRDGADG